MTPLACFRCARPIAPTDLRTCSACQAKFGFCYACGTASAGIGCPSCQSESILAPFVPSEVQSEPQWYETPPGRQRLALEYAEIERRGVASVSTAILPDRRLLFRFPLCEGDVRFLTVITRSNHPTSYPEVVLESEDAVWIPDRDSSGSARRLYVAVERSQALDRYQRAVSGRPTAAVDYFDCYRGGEHIDFAAALPGAPPWYSTDVGKRRLSDEIAAFKNAELKFESRLLASGDVAFVLDGVLLRRPERVVAVFPPEYPNASASISVGRESVQLSNPIDPHSPPFLGTAPLLVEVLASSLGERW